MFLCDERAVLIVDDRTDVWTTPKNVLKIFKFDFWPSTGNTFLNHSNVKIQKTIDTDWVIKKLRKRNRDNVLGTTANILQAIHRCYYYDKEIYGSMRISAGIIYSNLQKHVLNGVHIVFSGVFRNDIKHQKQYEWILAEQYGATCHLKMNKNITHLVAAKIGTQKVYQARQMNVYIVHINWLT